ncbi:MAG: hypothetical protein JSS14_00335 [Proteobacteria bacterium]|nr:hypothetical protein [Pseudomonadota bacterium]
MNSRLTVALALLLALAGCQTVTPNYDARFGDAVRDAKRAQTIDPDAGKKPVSAAAASTDGRASQEAMDRYHDAFKRPPPVVNVINIGGAIGDGGGGGGR